MNPRAAFRGAATRRSEWRRGVAQTHEERGRQGRSTIDRARRVQPRSPRSRRHLSTDGESDRRGATARDFNRDSIGSGRRATQRLTMNIPVEVSTCTTTGTMLLSLHDIHYSLIGYLPRSGVWQQNRARLSATGRQIRVDESHAKFVRWIISLPMSRSSSR